MIRKEFERRLARKQQEIEDLQRQLRDAEVYVQALNDVIRLIPREGEGSEVSGGELDRELRHGSAPAKAREAIRKAAKPLHISELLRAIGHPADKKARASLSGTLSMYVRDGKIFTRPAPNTFGLLELRERQPQSAPSAEPPEGFGIDNPGPAPAPDDDDIPF